MHHYMDKAKEHLTTLIGKAAGGGANGPSRQTVTIERPRPEVERFWREPENLARALDGIAEIHPTESGRLEWTFAPDSEHPITWESTSVVEENGLRFVDADEPDTAEIAIDFADAPHDRGTEVTIRAATPAPNLITGAAAFTALYRARALLQTGEAPTLAHNPSARAHSTDQEE
ncbi:hypothetical protein [Nocardia paucivorans]|uniref:hypothetical protein n=1 Tax=Nocardia paucivorans TaxID=114259 RepID=UPI0002DBDBD8|nr:hypothetical protein [Nocardia paucivorans]